MSNAFKLQFDDLLEKMTMFEESAKSPIFGDFDGKCEVEVSVAKQDCTNCCMPMEIKTETMEYHCLQCGMIKPSFGGVSEESTNDSKINISSGSTSSFYSVSSSKNSVLEKLKENQKIYTGLAFDTNLLIETANIYNNIRVVLAGKTDSVRREKVDEIIAAVLYYVCSANKTPRKKSEIARFMLLSHDGFSKGEDLVRMMANAKLIELNTDIDDTQEFIRGYLEKLNIDTTENLPFVCELLKTAEDGALGLESKNSSKIAAGLWILIRTKKYPIGEAAFEKTVGGCRSNTYLKFCNMVIREREVFKPLFNKYKLIAMDKY